MSINSRVDSLEKRVGMIKDPDKLVEGVCFWLVEEKGEHKYFMHNRQGDLIQVLEPSGVLLPLKLSENAGVDDSEEGRETIIEKQKREQINDFLRQLGKAQESV